MSAPVLTNVIQGDSRATLYYNNFDAGGKTIANYLYSLTGIFNSNPIYFDPPQTFTDGSYVITDLSNGSYYTVSLQCLYEDNIISNPSNYFRFKPGVPMAPTNLQPMITTNNSIVVFFIPPESNGLDASINYYYTLENINYWSNDNLFFNDFTSFPPYQSVSINNLFQQNYTNSYISAFNTLYYFYGIGLLSSPFNIDFSTFTSNEVNGSYLVNIDADTSFDILSNFRSIVSYINYNEKNSIVADQFDNFISLLGLTIPSNFEKIYDLAFSNTPILQNVSVKGSSSIENNVIHYNAFDLSGNNFANTNFTINGFLTQSVNQVQDDYLGLNLIITNDSSFSNITPISNIVNGLYFNSSVTNISENIFIYCPDISAVTIYSTVSNIGDNAFANLTNLTTVTFVQDISSNSTPTFSNNVFSGCTQLTNINGVSVNVIQEGLNVTIANDTDYQVLKYIAPLVYNVYIEPNVNNIPPQAFANCRNLQNVLGVDDKIYGLSKISSIGYRAFYNCSAIKSLNFQEINGPFGELSFVADEAFLNCSNLTTLHFHLLMNDTTYGQNVFSGCSSLSIINTNVNFYVDVSENVIDISNAGLHITFFPPDEIVYDFNSINIPFRSNVYAIDFSCNDHDNEYLFRNIGNNVFENFTGLKNITISSFCTEIGENAFSGCTSLKTVDCGADTLTVIHSQAFSGCTNLETFIVPPRLLYHESTGCVNVFQGCTSLNRMYNFNKTDYMAVEIEEKAFQNLHTGIKMLVTADSSNYSVLIPIRNWVSSVVYDKRITTINAFNNINNSFTSVQSIFIPESVTTLLTLSSGGSTFGNFDSLKEVTIPSSIESFSQEGGFAKTFILCSGLQSVTYDTSINIPGGMFYECLNLKNVYLNENIAEIGEETFVNCRSLQNITLPNSLTTIGRGAFNGSGLTSITLPASVTNISNGSFGNTPLTSVTILGATSIDNGGGAAFGNCVYLGSITIYYPFFAANYNNLTTEEIDHLQSDYDSSGNVTIDSGDNYNLIKNDVFLLYNLNPTITIITP